MKTKTTPAPSRKERKLEKQLAEKQALLKMASGDAVRASTRYVETASHLDFLQRENAALLRENSVIKDAAVITAEGLRIERDELLARARRLGMRIRGLGFNV